MVETLLYSGSLDTGNYNMHITATAAESVSTVTLLSRSSTKMQSQHLEYTNSFFWSFFFFFFNESVAGG